MPVYVLNSGGEIPLAQQPLRCTAATQNGVAIKLSASSGGQPLPGALDYGRSDMLVLPGVSVDTVISIAPAEAGATFPPGSVVNFSVFGAQGQNPDPDRVNLDTVDVSGLNSAELVHLSATQQGIKVRAVTRATVSSLSPLGDAARVCAASRAGATSVAPEYASTITAIIDTSASFRGRRDDGSLAAAVEILSGVADVFGRNQQLQLQVPGSRPFVPEHMEAVGEAAVTALAAAPRTTLFDAPAAVSNAIAAVTDKGAMHMLYLLTDQVNVRTQEAVQSAAAQDAALCPVVLAPADVSAFSARAAGVTSVGLDTGSGSGSAQLSADLLRDQGQVQDLAQQLIDALLIAHPANSERTR